MQISGKYVKIALVGNPNSGKSSLFNYLTGLNQKTGNFPGVTVEKRVGFSKMPDGNQAQFIDLPGIYSLYPRSLDEQIVSEILLNHKTPECPDSIVVIVDATNLKRSLLLVTQISDLGLPVVLALNMMDLVAKKQISYNLVEMSQQLGIPVIPINARSGMGVDQLKAILCKPIALPEKTIFPVFDEAKAGVQELRNALDLDNDYEAYQFLQQPSTLGFLKQADRHLIHQVIEKYKFFPGKFHGAETVQRYSFIQSLLDSVTIKRVMVS